MKKCASKKETFHSYRIKGHCCYSLAGGEVCNPNLVWEEHRSEHWGDGIPLSLSSHLTLVECFSQLTGALLHCRDGQRCREEGRPMSFAHLEANQSQGGTMEKQNWVGSGFIPSPAACTSAHTGPFAFHGLRCFIYKTEGLPQMIAMVLTSWKIYNISSILLI